MGPSGPSETRIIPITVLFEPHRIRIDVHLVLLGQLTWISFIHAENSGWVIDPPCSGNRNSNLQDLTGGSSLPHTTSRTPIYTHHTHPHQLSNQAKHVFVCVFFLCVCASASSLLEHLKKHPPTAALLCASWGPNEAGACPPCTTAESSKGRCGKRGLGPSSGHRAQGSGAWIRWCHWTLALQSLDGPHRGLCGEGGPFIGRVSPPKIWQGAKSKKSLQRSR